MVILKHLAAAVATWYMVVMFAKKYIIIDPNIRDYDKEPAFLKSAEKQKPFFETSILCQKSLHSP